MGKQQVVEEVDRVVVEALGRLQRAFAQRDVDAALACFAADGAAYGDDLGEHAHGHDELRPFLAEMFEESFVMAWDVRDLWARRRGDVLWFGAATEAVLDYPEGLQERLPFQLSGTLSRSPEGWLFELFNGTQPVSQGRELLVGA